MPRYEVEYRVIANGEGHLPQQFHARHVRTVEAKDAGHVYLQIVRECLEDNAVADIIAVLPLDGLPPHITTAASRQEQQDEQ